PLRQDHAPHPAQGRRGRHRQPRRHHHARRSDGGRRPGAEPRGSEGAGVAAAGGVSPLHHPAAAGGPPPPLRGAGKSEAAPLHVFLPRAAKRNGGGGPPRVSAVVEGARRQPAPIHAGRSTSHGRPSTVSSAPSIRSRRTSAMATPSAPDRTSPARKVPARISAPCAGAGPSKRIGSMRLLTEPRRFMRDVVSWPTKQPFLKSTPFIRSKSASSG